MVLYKFKVRGPGANIFLFAAAILVVLMNVGVLVEVGHRHPYMRVEILFYGGRLCDVMKDPFWTVAYTGKIRADPLVRRPGQFRIQECMVGHRNPFVGFMHFLYIFDLFRRLMQG